MNNHSNENELITPLSESGEHEVRLEKVTSMQQEGLLPWPSFKPVTHTTAQALADYQKEGQETSPHSYIIAGRLLAKRDHGKTFFGTIQDRAGTLQIYIKKDDIGEKSFEQFKKYIDVGDIIWLSGPIFTTKTGHATLKTTEVSLLSKCLYPLPEKFHGLTDVEQRYRQRYLDLISSPETKEKFIRRSKAIQMIRTFLGEHDFVEVETPMLHPIPGGAAARPFVTHHNAYDMDLYLRIAPELYLKRLVIGGIERVFEINRNFRNEGVSTRHNPEFTMLEFYMAHANYMLGIQMTEQLISRVVQETVGAQTLLFQDRTIDFTPPFKVLTVHDSIIDAKICTEKELQGSAIDAVLQRHNIEVDATASHSAKLYAIFERLVEPAIVQPTFITGYPIEISPLARTDEQNSAYAARFELFVCGMELANGYSELNNPIEQAQRFKQQLTQREKGDAEAHHYDADYVKALEYGLPPTAGVGIGIDRLVMFLTNTVTIKDVILFPTLKSVKD